MGVAYCVAPLHRMHVLDVGTARPRTIRPGDGALLNELAAFNGGTAVLDGPVAVRSTGRQAIVAWREGLSTKYSGQLETPLTWDEDSAFQRSDEVGTHDDMSLLFAAAALDLQGPDGLRQLADAPPSPEAVHATIERAAAHGFAGRYPHLLLGAEIWLPYQAMLVMEEPDWNGRPGRYGSTHRLLDELTAVRSALQRLRPTRTSRLRASSAYSAAGAWQSLTSRLHLTSLAVQRRLPVWATH